MEGHNVMGAVWRLARRFAVKKAMEQFKIPGTIVLSIGPAEEQLMSRPYLVRDGYFKDVDAAILTHVADSSATGYGLQNYALIGAKFTFKGRTAHGGVNPWDGKDAVDAVVLMDIGFDKLREHLRPTYRGHRTITHGGVQPNIIPDMGQIWWFIRDANGPWAKENFDKLVNIARGAALMTGTTMEMEPFGAAWPSLGNKAIAEAIQKNIEMVGMPKWTDEENKFAKELQKSLGKKEEGLPTKVEPLRAVTAEQFVKRYWRYYLGRTDGHCSVSRRRAWSARAPLDGGNHADDVDRAQRRGGRRQGYGGVRFSTC